MGTLNCCIKGQDIRDSGNKNIAFLFKENEKVSYLYFLKHKEKLDDLTAANDIENKNDGNHYKY